MHFMPMFYAFHAYVLCISCLRFIHFMPMFYALHAYVFLFHKHVLFDSCAGDLY